MNIECRHQTGISLILAIIATLLFALIGVYMTAISSGSILGAAQSFGATQARFVAKSGVEWAAHHLKKNGVTNCSCATPVAIDGKLITFSAAKITGFQAAISCSGTQVKEKNETYCIYDIAVEAQRGTKGATAYIARKVTLSFISL